MGRNDDFFNKNGKSNRDNGEYEYFEDTHNKNGEFIGSKNQTQSSFSFSQSESMKNMAESLPTKNDYTSPRHYQNVVVYAPKNPDDVQRLIDYMKRREPAIVNLDNVEAGAAQRILDFVSGAIYALNGSVHRISSNIFLLSPEGVEITVPYEPSKY